MRQLRYAVVVGAAMLLACADQGGTPAAGPSSSTTSAVSTPATTMQPGELTVRGTVQPGVEPGCLLLNAPQGAQYLLLGGDRQVLRPHAEVVVRGRPQPDLLTTCQQGIPFTVIEARPS